VSFENLRMEHSTGSAVQGPGPVIPGNPPASAPWPFPGDTFISNVSMSGCVIANTGGHGVAVHNCFGCTSPGRVCH
jgi:hypothetical protein